MPSDGPLPIPIGEPTTGSRPPVPIPAPPEKSTRIWPLVLLGVLALLLGLGSCGALMAIAFVPRAQPELDEAVVEKITHEYPDYEILTHQIDSWETKTDHEIVSVTIEHKEYPFELLVEYERTRYRDSDRWTEWGDPYGRLELFKVGGSWEGDNPEGFIEAFCRRHEGQDVTCFGVWPDMRTLEEWQCGYTAHEHDDPDKVCHEEYEDYQLDRSDKSWMPSYY